MVGDFMKLKLLRYNYVNFGKEFIVGINRNMHIEPDDSFDIDSEYITNKETCGDEENSLL